jgi:hypothetical protein
LRLGSATVRNSYLFCVLGGVALTYVGWKMVVPPFWTVGQQAAEWFLAARAGLIVYGLRGLFRRKSDDDL